MGRFLQVDPTGFDAGDMNVFRYCNDDPIDGSDPTGLNDVARVAVHPLTGNGGGDWDWFNGRVAEQQQQDAMSSEERIGVSQQILTE